MVPLAVELLPPSISYTIVDMNATNPNQSTCPSFEDISAWVDQELPAPDVDRHINGCHACQKCVQELRAIDAAASAMLAVDPLAMEQVASHCLAEIRQSSKPRLTLTMSVILKVAAAVAMVGLIVFLSDKVDSGATRVAKAVGDNPSGVQQNAVGVASVSSTPPAVIAQNDPQPAATSPAISTGAAERYQNQLLRQVVAARQGAPVGTQNSDTAQRDNSDGALNLSDINLVGFGVSAPNLASPARASRDTEPNDEIGDSVHHVWVVNDPTLPLAALQTLLPRQKSIIEQLMSRDQDAYHLQFRVDELNLQRLVNHFHQLGCKLLSPANPQPGADCAGNPASARRAVQYSVDIVKK